MPTLSASVLQTQLEKARMHTDQLFALLEPEVLYERPVAERHRLIFYLGHLEAFDWNTICKGVLGMPSFHPRFDHLFAFGIDPEPGQAPNDTPRDWPSLSELQQYNAEVRRKFDEALGSVPEQMVHVAIEHRDMHAETFAYLLHNLPFGHKRKPAVIAPPSAPPASDPNARIVIPEGTATLGQAPGEFGWDNEFPRHQVYVPQFSVNRYKVTNGEYLEFVQHTGAQIPHFWVVQDGTYFFRGMFELVPLPLDWPAWVTQSEATAFAEWRGKRIMTEPEFHRAAYGTPEGNERAYPWGNEPPASEHGNFNFQYWDPTPVSSHPKGDSAWGVSQLVGNGWEWTSTDFAPFDGFERFSFYPGYSANFFDGKHFVIKGGSPRTSAALVRRSFRNWFRPDYKYVYAGFRLASN